MTHDTDTLLGVFLNLADAGVGVSVTVIADGQLITGEPVPYGIYLGDLTELFRSGLPTESDFEPALEALKEAATTAEDRREQRHARREAMRNRGASAAEMADSDLETSDELNYLHLRSVTIGTGSETTTHALWRVRVDAITGWSLGRRKV